MVDPGLQKDGLLDMETTRCFVQFGYGSWSTRKESETYNSSKELSNIDPILIRLNYVMERNNWRRIAGRLGGLDGYPGLLTVGEYCFPCGSACSVCVHLKSMTFCAMEFLSWCFSQSLLAR